MPVRGGSVCDEVLYHSFACVCELISHYPKQLFTEMHDCPSVIKLQTYSYKKKGLLVIFVKGMEWSLNL